MCKRIETKNLFYVTVEDAEGDYIFESYMEADDVSKIKTYIKDNFSIGGFAYEIAKPNGCYIDSNLISEI